VALARNVMVNATMSQKRQVSQKTVADVKAELGLSSTDVLHVIFAVPRGRENPVVVNEVEGAVFWQVKVSLTNLKKMKKLLMTFTNTWCLLKVTKVTKFQIIFQILN
jgi:hypothetical protein